MKDQGETSRLKRSTLMVMVLLIGSVFILPQTVQPAYAFNNYVEGIWTSWTLYDTRNITTLYTSLEQVIANVGISSDGTILSFFDTDLDTTYVQATLVVYNIPAKSISVTGSSLNLRCQTVCSPSTGSAYNTYKVTLTASDSNLATVRVFRDGSHIQSLVPANGPWATNGGVTIGIDPTGEWILVIASPSNDRPTAEDLYIFRGVGTSAASPGQGGGAPPLPCDTSLGYVCTLTTTSTTGVAFPPSEVPRISEENPILGVIIIVIIIVVVSAIVLRMTKSEKGFRDPNNNKVQFRRPR